MNTTITIELCAEDRARLDKIIEKLGEIQQPNCSACVKTVAEVVSVHPAEAQAAAEEPAPDEAPTETPEPVEEIKPVVTLEQIQQKVVQLAAAGKKAEVRQIVNTYGAKVSDLKDQPDKWGEVWDKLTALEG